MIEAGYRKKAEEIKADGRLSAEGKAEKLAELKTADSKQRALDADPHLGPQATRRHQV